MNAQHTPGPWIVRKGAGWFISRPDASSRREAALAVGMQPDYTSVGSPGPDWFDDAEAKANALLMASAPDLLAALEAMYELCCHANPDAFKNGVTDPTGSMDEGDHIAGSIMDRAKAAIAKATGT